MNGTTLSEDASPATPARRSFTVPLIAFAVTLVIGLVGVTIAVIALSRDPAPQTIEIVVPAGTQARLDAGEKVVVMPDRIELRVGDTLVVRNEDSSTQSVGPFVVGPGRESRLTYGAPGEYEGYCPLSEGERYSIVVTP